MSKQPRATRTSDPQSKAFCNMRLSALPLRVRHVSSERTKPRMLTGRTSEIALFFLQCKKLRVSCAMCETRAVAPVSGGAFRPLFFVLSTFVSFLTGGSSRPPLFLGKNPHRTPSVRPRGGPSGGVSPRGALLSGRYHFVPIRYRFCPF